MLQNGLLSCVLVLRTGSLQNNIALFVCILQVCFLGKVLTWQKYSRAVILIIFFVY